MLSNENDLDFAGYEMVRADYPGNIKKGGAFTLKCPYLYVF